MSEERGKCWSCVNFSYKYPRKYGHCSWQKIYILIFRYLASIDSFEHMPRFEDGCNGYDKGMPKYI